MARRKYLEFKEAGLCVRCGAERWEGKTRCEVCHKQHLAYQEKAKTKAISNGKCRYCLVSPVEQDKSMCGSCLEKHGAKSKQTYQKHRSACLEAYDGRCRCCGNGNPKYLQLDHIDDDGAEHRRLIFNGRGGSMWTWAYRNGFPDTLQLLCANCHQGKTVYGGCDEHDHPPYTP